MPALTGPLSSQGEAIIKAMGAGQLSPTEAGAMLAALTSQARLVESTELVQRIEKLEEMG
ncbi:MAG: hypothetical protein HQM03_06280 [Magnetococcales bacterium]|nr:hypothetical protein [Magnetococcales bacterium]